MEYRKCHEYGIYVPDTDVFNNNISRWDVSSVTFMERTFASAKQFNQDVSGWDTRIVIDMDWMFQDAQAFNVDVTNWNITALTTKRWMFEIAIGFTHVICWDTSGKNDHDIFENSPGSNRC